MDALQTILNRHSVRDWSDKDVPADILSQILEAGRRSPSPLNSQPWHFIVVQNQDTIEKLMGYAKHGSFLSRAAAVIVVTIEKPVEIDKWLDEHEQYLFSGAAALYNMWLTSSALGLGSCWVTMDEQKTEEILSIPSSQKIIGSLATGYPKTDVLHIAPKKTLEEVVSYEKYGH